MLVESTNQARFKSVHSTLCL